MATALLLVDVIKDFLHEDGDRLLESYREPIWSPPSRHDAAIRLS